MQQDILRQDPDFSQVRAIAKQERDDALAFAGPAAGGRAIAAGLLPALHRLQAQFGCVSPAMIAPVADVFNLSQAEVRGVVSFYHDFREAPAGRRLLKLCRAEACQAVGGEELADHLERRHGLKPGDTSPDGALSVENVYCLGNCALGPSALVDDQLIGRLDASALDRLIAEARR